MYLGQKNSLKIYDFNSIKELNEAIFLVENLDEASIPDEKNKGIVFLKGDVKKWIKNKINTNHLLLKAANIQEALLFCEYLSGYSQNVIVQLSNANLKQIQELID